MVYSYITEYSHLTMKIAFIGQKGIPTLIGGVEKHVEGLAVHMAARGHEVFAYTRPHYTDPNLKEYKGVHLISLPSLKTKNLDAISHTFFACLDLLRRKVDIVHFHSIGPSSLIWLVRLLKPNVKIVATFHCQDYYHQKWSFFARTYLKFGEWMACRFADATLSISKLLESYAWNAYSTVVKYIPNGVPAATIRETNEIAKRWNLSKGSYILAVSRLIRHKGLHYLIESFRKLDTDKKLVIVGDGSFTDEYVIELKKTAEGDDRIIFTGAQHGAVLEELFSNAYMFVQPSVSEGLSLVLLEAMSYGLTPLVSDIPENTQAIVDGKTGITFRAKDVADLSAKLQNALVDPLTLSRIGAAAKEQVCTENNWENTTSEIEQVYGELMSQTISTRFKRNSFAARISTLL